MSLGLALASVYCIFNSRLVMASVFFSLSLNFKQMGLFYSTTFFFYLLGMCIDTRNMCVPSILFVLTNTFEELAVS